MHLLNLILLSLVVGVVQAQGPYHGPDWQIKPAQEKLKALWTEVVKDSDSNSWPGIVEKLELFLEVMNLTFDFPYDDFMVNEFKTWPHRPGVIRPKIIHSVGVIGVVSWISNQKHNYTGLFTGAKESGFIRMSLAAEPTVGSNPNMAPGIGLKFLRDGMPSSNMMAMFMLTGQSSFNFFEHDLTNHVPDLGTSAPWTLRQVRDTFAAASKWPTLLGLSDFASFTGAGKPVQNPQFPFRLVFHPTTVYHKKFSNTQPSAYVLEELAAGLSPKTELYQIYAQPVPTSDELIPIGSIQLESVATTSFFNDKTMFLQHVRMENDLALRPEWEGPIADIIKFQQSQSSFQFPDLPWQ